MILRRKVYHIVIFMSAMWLSGCASAARFDCMKAATEVDKRICSNDDLSKLDEEVAQVYYKAQTRTAEPERFINEQRTWLNERRGCLQSDNPSICLTAMYRERIQVLSGDCWHHESWYTGMGSAKYIASGENVPICRLMLENLNRFCHVPRDVMLDPPIDPGITSLKTVKWNDLEPLLNLEWVGDAYMYRQYRPEREPDEWGKEVVMKFLKEQAGSGKVRMWEARFDLTNDGVEDVVRRAKTEHETSDENEGLRFGGIGLVLINEDTNLPYTFGTKKIKTFVYSRKVIINAGTTYLVRRLYAPESTYDDIVAMEIVEPFTGTYGGSLPRERWHYSEKRVCKFTRNDEVSED